MRSFSVLAYSHQKQKKKKKKTERLSFPFF